MSSVNILDYCTRVVIIHFYHKSLCVSSLTPLARINEFHGMTKMSPDNYLPFPRQVVRLWNIIVNYSMRHNLMRIANNPSHMPKGFVKNVKSNNMPVEM